MLLFTELSTEQQKEYRAGVVELHGFNWKCHYKFVSEDLIEIYSEYSNYVGPCYTHYKSLVTP